MECAYNIVMFYKVQVLFCFVATNRNLKLSKVSYLPQSLLKYCSSTAQDSALRHRLRQLMMTILLRGLAIANRWAFENNHWLKAHYTNQYKKLIYSECFLANSFKANGWHNSCFLLSLFNAEGGRKNAPYRQVLAALILWVLRNKRELKRKMTMLFTRGKPHGLVCSRHT